MRNHPIKEATCFVCHTPFKYRWPQAKAKFCSSKCRNKDYADRHKDQINEKNRIYRTEHADKRQETLRKYHEGRGKAVAKVWRQHNWDRLKAELKARYHNDETYRKRLNSRTRSNQILRASAVPYECRGCGSTKRLHCHHINENPMDRKLINLMWLCHWCHMRLHLEERERERRTLAFLDSTST